LNHFTVPLGISAPIELASQPHTSTPKGFDHRSPEAIASGPTPPQQRPTYIRPEQRLVIGSAIPNVIPSALQHRCEGTLLIVCRHSRGIMISDQLSLGHPNERDRQGRMGDVLERYQFRATLI
jgi:hypothetical protein